MVYAGIDTIIKKSVYAALFSNKRTALVSNYTGLTKNFRRTIDVLKERSHLIKLFSPEHGLYGAAQAGEAVNSCIDKKTGLPVKSLYGDSKKIAMTDLADIDLLAFDIQDAGLRFYTYIYTMIYALEAAAQRGIPFVVFDRPNPLNGDVISGNIIQKDCESFVGAYALPQRYGMTIGELARYFAAYKKIDCALHIIPLENWKRSFFYENTGLRWVLPSPNLPCVESLFAYSGICLFEGTNVSEGRGTTLPMQLIGAPWIDGDSLEKKLNTALKAAGIRGLMFRSHRFIPAASKYAGILCEGVQIHFSRSSKQGADMLQAAVLLIDILHTEYPKDFAFLEPWADSALFPIDRISGSHTLRLGLTQKYLEEIKKGGIQFRSSLQNMRTADGQGILLYD